MLNLKSLLITFLIVCGISFLGYVYWNHLEKSLYTIIGIIILMFIRHTYVAVNHTLKTKE